MKESLKKIIYSLHPLERKILKTKEINDISKISKETSLNEAEINTGLMLLEKNNFAQIKTKEETYIELDRYGKKFLETDLPEIKLLKEVIENEKKQSELTLEKV
jgi:hypothetical protein